MDSRKLQKAYVCNIVTGVIILFSVVWMFSGITFGHYEAALSAAGFGMLKYYTVDSNIIMGDIAFI